MLLFSIRPQPWQLHHASKALILFLEHGYLAVSFFFILSGFILTYNYADRWPSVSLREYLLARFARIYPIYLLALLLELPFFGRQLRC